MIKALGSTGDQISVFRSDRGKEIGSVSISDVYNPSVESLALRQGGNRRLDICSYPQRENRLPVIVEADIPSLRVQLGDAAVFFGQMR